MTAPRPAALPRPGRRAGRGGRLRWAGGSGAALTAALELARSLAALPPAALRSDRMSSYEQWSLPLDEALANEFQHGMRTIATGELWEGVERYAASRPRKASAPEEP